MSGRRAEALAYVDKSIDNVADLDPDLTWTNAEVVEMLDDIRSLLVTGQVTPRARPLPSTGDPRALCPECRDGKPDNCIGWTLDANDAEIPCERVAAIATPIAPVPPVDAEHLVTFFRNSQGHLQMVTDGPGAECPMCGYPERHRVWAEPTADPVAELPTADGCPSCETSRLKATGV